jgi:signal transduction histidine kinase
MRPKTLLIDDEQDFVRLLAARLEARDFPVLIAFDASDGLKSVESDSPAVVVLDVNLPDRSGLDVLREIKERWPLVQVVMLTGQSDVATAVTGMKLGALDYLVKPVDIEPLGRAIERAASRRTDQEESLRMIEIGKLAALGRLAEGVAHEINNPVNTMMQKAQWAGELLEEEEFVSCGSLSEVQAELEGIVRQARRCKDIVSKLMSLGGRIDPRATEFDPCQAVQAVLTQAGERARGIGVTVSTSFEPGAVSVHLPRAEIEQVLTHLVDNALDAMSPSGGSLMVTVRRGESGSVRIEVADTGPGVAPAIAERIFEPFFSTKDVGMGSGLGLAICHGIMKSLGGDVELVRDGRQGAVFAVSFPSLPAKS